MEKFTGYEPRGVMQLKLNELIEKVNELEAKFEKQAPQEPVKKTAKKTEE